MWHFLWKEAALNKCTTPLFKTDCHRSGLKTAALVCSLSILAKMTANALMICSLLLSLAGENKAEYSVIYSCFYHFVMCLMCHLFDCNNDGRLFCWDHSDSESVGGFGVCGKQRHSQLQIQQYWCNNHFSLVSPETRTNTQTPVL